MGIFPIMMNVVQFWVIDSIVKASSGVAPFLDIERGEYHDQQPLFEDHSEAGDDEGPTVHAPDTRRQSSLSSSASRELDDSSLTTDMANPEDEHKSSASSSRQVSDIHNYPPSLSSSFSSDSTSPYPSKGPREAKNLQRKVKRRDFPQPLITRPKVALPSPGAPSSFPTTPSPKHATVSITEDRTWTESWDDPVEWDAEIHQKQSTTTTGQWNIITERTVS